MGEAFYEIGVHDNGERIGITYEQCAETILALYHMSQSLAAKLQIEAVSLGTEGYSVRLRVTKLQPEAIEPEIDAFISGLSILKKYHVYESVAMKHCQVEERPAATVSIITHDAD